MAILGHSWGGAARRTSLIKTLLEANPVIQPMEVFVVDICGSKETSTQAESSGEPPSPKVLIPIRPPENQQSG